MPTKEKGGKINVCVAVWGYEWVCKNMSGILDGNSFVSRFHCLSTMKMYECFNIYNDNHSLDKNK